MNLCLRLCPYTPLLDTIPPLLLLSIATSNSRKFAMNIVPFFASRQWESVRDPPQSLLVPEIEMHFDFVISLPHFYRPLRAGSLIFVFKY